MAKDKGGSGLISVGRVAENRRARHDYFIQDTIEVGIVLFGTEVKSLRLGRANIQDAYAGRKGDLTELWLYNVYIPEYSPAKHFTHETRRPRKLLLHKREIVRLLNAVNRDGMTIVPLSIYFNDQGRAKLSLGLAKGKNAVDKRETIKERDWNRQKQRVLRDRG
ncbi:SsrA-binding protein SmpB [Insolitispirillum peregrinum]|uniref:SsrA-binding protein n=1 Tax=Insolitispirillum peregrinum TaxID=80876 RepID=A0A1N7IUW3_9PROT|nr:SsrA-binding protein SmpB [Insolitispirillum peregrinum]SIS40885.1 SsrA-binding protein [Insolitispirillum peregrinum]